MDDIWEMQKHMYFSKQMPKSHLLSLEYEPSQYMDTNTSKLYMTISTFFTCPNA
jgi:general stress protein 26